MLKANQQRLLQRALRAQRGYATPAQSSLDFSVTEASGFKVAAQEASTALPTSAITVAIKAGPRYEPTAGTAHALKNFVFRSTSKRSALRLIRETEVYGGLLSSTLGREHLYLTAEFLKGDEDYFADILGAAIAEAKLINYEYAESVVPLLEADYAQASADAAVWGLDLAHALAFRKGLGNSLFAVPHSEVSFETAKSFATSTFSSPANVAIAASNVDASSLKSLVGQYFTTSGSASASPASASGKYYGGEARVPHRDDLLVVAFQGGPASSAPHAVLKHLLGGESSVKWSKASAASFASAPGAVAFNVGYSDNGLIGFTAPTGQAAKQAVDELKKVAKGGLKPEDVKRAIAKAKFEAASAAETRSHLEVVASQILASGSVASLSTTFGSLDKVTGDDLTKAAAAALKSKPSFVALGNTQQLPYADELGL